jgi:hypothetical protein
MDILNTKSDDELLASIVAELAKAKNELACAQRDIDKATGRIGFLLMIANTMINR